MGNKTKFKLNIDADGLIRIMKEKHISTRELARKDTVNYSERSIRHGLKTRKMTLQMIMEICNGLDLAFATHSGKQGVIFDPMEQKGWGSGIRPAGYIYWEPVTDPAGFMYPRPF